MRYHNITKDDMLNGSGLRVVLWVSGCVHCCPQCHNPITWDPNGGLPFTDAQKQEIFQELDKDYISGITFSGGDPLHIRNITEVTALAREITPDLPLHGSTQMTVHSLAGVERAAELGMKCVVLGRELSGEDIRFICRRSPIAIEVFAHGALCMCWSGQCAMSALIGQRSGNRGLCAQPCRLP